MLIPRRIPLLLMAAMSLAITKPAPAQEDAQGTARIEIYAGYETAYGNYCLPVANGALGRQSAKGGNLEWQLASNFSVVPVFVKISHRQSIAMTGHIEVTSNNPYYPQESPGMHTMTLSRDFIAPPGVPITVAMAPRVAPVAAPGRPVSLDVRIFRKGNEKPFATYQVQATQLEPGHVYSLLITDSHELARPMASTIDISKYASLPDIVLKDKSPPYPGLLSFNHYLLPIEASTFTALPLAARDYAFVCVDAKQANTWTAEQQASLEQFVLAGGYLCVFDSGEVGKLASLDLTRSHQLGRGFLLVVSGGLDSARRQMDGWLRGELEEFALWMYGSVNGTTLFGGQGEGRYTLRDASQLQLDLRSAYAGPVPTHAPGYLNPIWLYRETCRAGAIEPWDYPEFNVPYFISRPSTLRPGRDPLLQNWNLALVAQQLRGMLIKPLRDLAQPVRSIGKAIYFTLVAMTAFAVAALLALRQPRRGTLLSSGTLLLSLLFVGSWLAQTPEASSETRLTLLDTDVAASQCVVRSLAAMPTRDADKAILHCFDLVRLIRSEEAGDSYLHLSAVGPAGASAEAQAQVVTRGPLITLASDGVCGSSDHKGWPVRLWRTAAADETQIHVDTSRLAKGSAAVLFTPDGTELIPGGIEDHVTAIKRVAIPLEPGERRLMQWRSRYVHDRRPLPRTRQGRMFSPWSGAPDTFALLRMAVSDETVFSTDSNLRRLGWAGLLQTVGGTRALIGNQCWLYCELPSDNTQEAKFLRLTMPLTQ